MICKFPNSLVFFDMRANTKLRADNKKKSFGFCHHISTNIDRPKNLLISNRKQGLIGPKPRASSVVSRYLYYLTMLADHGRVADMFVLVCLFDTSLTSDWVALIGLNYPYCPNRPCNSSTNPHIMDFVLWFFYFRALRWPKYPI